MVPKGDQYWLHLEEGDYYGLEFHDHAEQWQQANLPSSKLERSFLILGRRQALPTHESGLYDTWVLIEIQFQEEGCKPIFLGHPKHSTTDLDTSQGKIDRPYNFGQKIDLSMIRFYHYWCVNPPTTGGIPENEQPKPIELLSSTHSSTTEASRAPSEAGKGKSWRN